MGESREIKQKAQTGSDESDPVESLEQTSKAKEAGSTALADKSSITDVQLMRQSQGSTPKTKELPNLELTRGGDTNVIPKGKEEKVAEESSDIDLKHLSQVFKDLKNGTRSAAALGKDLVDTISTLSKEKIESLNKSLQESGGKSISDLLDDDKQLSKAQKFALAIYLKGTENRRLPGETSKLIENALESKNIDLFQQAMRDASLSDRSDFIKAGGIEIILSQFGQEITDDYGQLLGYSQTRNSRLARDYAELGHARLNTLLNEQASIFGADEKAIKAAIDQTPDYYKERLVHGALVEAVLRSGKDPAELAASSLEDRAEYLQVKNSLSSVTNETQALRWIDYLDKGGTELIPKLAQLRSLFGSSDFQALEEIKKISKNDWERLKDDPLFKERVEQVLKALALPNQKYLQNNLDRLAYTTKDYQNAARDTDSTYYELQVLRGKWDQGRSFVKALENMDENFRVAYQYKSNTEFRKYIKDAAQGLSSEVCRDAALDLLAQAELGKTPKLGLEQKLKLATINYEVWLNPEGRKQMIGLLTEAFKEDPGLKERVLNPKPEDAELLNALHEAFPQFNVWTGQIDSPPPFGISRFAPVDLFKAYVEPLARDGKLSLQARASVIGTYDRAAFIGEIAVSSPEDRKIFLEDQLFQRRMIGYWTENEQNLALKVADQGSFGLEDSLRLSFLNADKKAIEGVYAGLPNQLKPFLTLLFEAKYGPISNSIQASFKNAADRLELEQTTKAQTPDARANFNEARARYQKDREGFFAAFVNQISGTGVLADNALNQYAAEMSRQSTKDPSAAPADLQKLKRNLEQSLTLFLSSKEQTADTLADATIAILALSTGGGGLALIARAAALGAALKPGMKTALLGYEHASESLAIDISTGGANGGFNALVPLQIARVLGLGERVGALVADAVQGTRLVAEGREAAFSTAVQDLAKETIKSKSAEPSKALLERIGTAFAAPGAKEALIQSIKLELSKQSYSVARDFLKLEVLPNALSAGLSSGGISAVESLAKDKSAQETLSRAILAVAFGFALGSATSSLLGAREATRLSFAVGDADRLSEAIIKRSIPIEAAIVQKAALDLSARTKLSDLKIKDAMPLSEVFEAPKDGTQSFMKLKADVANMQFKDQTDFLARGIDYETRTVKVFKVQNSPLEFAMTPEYAAKLDELRNLRLAAGKAGSTDPVIAEAATQAAAALANHPLRNVLLPEQILQILSETPNNGRLISRITLHEENSPADWYLRESNTQFGAFVRNGNSIDILPTTTIANLRNNLQHENAHILQYRYLSDFEAFKSAAKLEKDGFYAREYAKLNDGENWAVHFGEEFLHAKTSVFTSMVHAAPARAIAAAALLKKTLSEHAGTPSVFAQQFQERIIYVETRVIPQFKNELENAIKSGDSIRLATCLDFLSDLSKTAEGLDYARKLSQALTLNDLPNLLQKAVNEKNEELAKQSLRFLETFHESKAEFRTLLGKLVNQSIESQNPTIITEAIGALEKAGGDGKGLLLRVLKDTNLTPENSLVLSTSKLLSGLSDSERTNLIIELAEARGISSAIMYRLTELRPEELKRAVDAIEKLPAAKLNAPSIIKEVCDTPELRYSAEGQRLLDIALRNTGTDANASTYDLVRYVIPRYFGAVPVGTRALAKADEILMQARNQVNRAIRMGRDPDEIAVSILSRAENLEDRQLWLDVYMKKQGHQLLDDDKFVEGTVLDRIKLDSRLSFLETNKRYFTERLFKQMEERIKQRIIHL